MISRPSYVGSPMDHAYVAFHSLSSKPATVWTED